MGRECINERYEILLKDRGDTDLSVNTKNEFGRLEEIKSEKRELTRLFGQVMLEFLECDRGNWG